MSGGFLFFQHWSDEGVAWHVPAHSDIPVYRLFHPGSGEHFYTKDTYERSILLSSGWNDEGIGWYSDEEYGQPVYRLFNPEADSIASHLYTTDLNECDVLSKNGWLYEGICWYGMDYPSVQLISDNSPIDTDLKKQISILGDSISALEDMIPKGYASFYKKPNYTEKDMWFHTVIQKKNGALCVNGSWNGSLVTGTYPSISSMERISALSAGETAPDIVLVFAGTNDYLWQIDLSTFYSSYTEMLSRIHKRFPRAEIECATLICTRPPFSTQEDYVSVTAYNKAIRIAAQRAGAKLIDLEINASSIDTIDGIHPSKRGQQMISALWN